MTSTRTYMVLLSFHTAAWLMVQGHIVAEQQLPLPASILEELEVKQRQPQQQRTPGVYNL